ncbi:MAG: DNA polymerase III subunit gamma/tau [Chitinophagales bacterium]|nr:DNA polymerase III subunit gamma/tau [Chitinophagales bacterium]MBP8754057.1 DNA polymerase III subunit gamma/tau [Chitinophagales bacterium]MBP9190002.1 DNA polymerase III subunit gamma/tau [Chitinophagales bacterium]MBP9549167.1 DNA polymerase III subunit gamma/tau [Chitinophagales bacterium]MBP9704597.1 DNA polymerase III subunit gamma/tau [Chitinophagales bacterium]
MQSFVVSARKYRPATWDDVIGQEHVVTTLRNAIKNNHLAQSFLFCGPRGVGKTTCARILAKTINCENLQPDGEACDKCESCKSFRQNASFNIHEIDAASNNSVEDIRSLTDQVRYAPQEGKYKIYIIDEVHMLSAAAFNAFLKTLEEPPAYVKFILATTEKHKIIPTILSRCQIFDFNRIHVKDMIKQLKKICKSEDVNCEDEAIHLIAQKADGAMRDALSIFDRITTFAGKNITGKDVIENLNILDYTYYFKITDALLAEDAASVLLYFDEIISKGFDGDTFLIGLSEHFRNLLVCKDPKTIKLLELSETVIEKYQHQSEIVSASFLLSGLNILNQADVQYRISKNKRLHVELALLKLCYIHGAIHTYQTEGTLPEKKTPVVKTPKQFSPEKVKTETTSEEKAEYIPEKKKEILHSAETVSMPKKGSLRQNILNKNSEISAENKEEIKLDKKTVIPELFILAWKEYADSIRSDLQRVAVLMDHAVLTFSNEAEISIGLDSQVEINIMQTHITDLKSFLYDAIDNNTFDIQLNVIEKTKTAKRPYTAIEKFKKMAEANPLIQEIKDTLGFELDY